MQAFFSTGISLPGRNDLWKLISAFCFYTKLVPREFSVKYLIAVEENKGIKYSTCSMNMNLVFFQFALIEYQFKQVGRVVVGGGWGIANWLIFKRALPTTLISHNLGRVRFSIRLSFSEISSSIAHYTEVSQNLTKYSYSDKQYININM